MEAAVIDLLGVLAYGELIAYERLTTDAQLAPSLADKVALGTMANAEFHHFQLLSKHLADRGVDPLEAMGPFVEPLDSFHDSTQPSDWYEGLIKAYVGDGMATDFYREVATYVQDAETRTLIEGVLADTGQASFAVAKVKAIIAEEPSVGGRLALWARRLVGEALIQAQYVAVERDALLELLVGANNLAGITGLLKSITDQHTARMARLGLEA
ncbi:MAG: tRNA 2-methylthio-N6-isopentenyl adenosine(37) hydroxylase MiaE-like protein [Frankiales bacterium]|nr:tRNA 2-methylthio-N6-isopentenyl adenosine(37) hydroxylase MiaE-like protein [Frankiales bacterium]